MISERRGANKRPLWLAAVYLALSALGALALLLPLPLTGSALLMGAVGVFAVLSATATPKLSVPMGIAALAAVFFIGQKKPIFIFLGALALIMSAVLTVAVKKKSPKSGTAVALTAALVIGAVLIAAALYLMAGNAFTPKDVGKAIDKVLDFPKNIMTELTLRYFDGLTEAEKELLVRGGVELDQLRETALLAADATGTMIRSLAPGLVIAAAQILSYIAVCVFVLAAKCARLYALLPEPKWVLYPTQITCIVFLAALLLNVIVSFFPSVGVVGLAISNLLLILLPSMTACGIRGIVVRLRHPLLRRRTLIFLIIFAALTVSTLGVFLPFTVMLLAFLGARDVSSLRAIEASYRKDKKD